MLVVVVGDIPGIAAGGPREPDQRDTASSLVVGILVDLVSEMGSCRIAVAVAHTAAVGHSLVGEDIVPAAAGRLALADHTAVVEDHRIVVVRGRRCRKSLERTC